MHLTKDEERILLEVCALYSGRYAETEFFARTGREMSWDRMRRAVKLRKTEPEITVDWDDSDWKNGSGTGIGTGYVVVFKPDSHGMYVDPQAYSAFLNDLKILRPKIMVNLGDGLDAGGTFTSHAASYLRDLDYSYEADCAAQNAQLDEEQKYCETIRYIAGNHENRIERWCSQTISNRRAAQAACEAIAPDTMLRLKERGIEYVRTDRTYDGLTVPGTIRIGKCHAQHGYSISKHAAAAHLTDFNECLVFGHVHRSQSYLTRTVRSDAIGAWTSGCLSLLQPTWQHSKPTGWTHGYGLAFFERDGRFVYLHIPIVNGWSGLKPLLDVVRPERLHG